MAPEPAPTVTLDDLQNCKDPFSNNQWVTSEHSSPNYSMSGVQAWLDLPGTGATFSDCQPIGSDPTGGQSAWVSINEWAGGGTRIAQIGIIKCHAAFGSVAGDCAGPAHEGDTWYFWAAGGCGTALPQPRFIGNVTSFSLTGFMVQLTSSRINMFIDYPPADGVWVQEVSIARSDPGVSCWVGTGDPIKVQVSTERLDRGDSAGYSSVVKTHFEFLRYSVLNQVGWNKFGAGCQFNTGGASGSVNRTFCQYTQGSSSADTNTMNVWD